MKTKHLYFLAPVLLAIISMGVTCTFHPVTSALAQTDERLQQLPADQKPLAQRMIKFISTIVVQFFDSGMSFAGGWLGIMPGTRIEGDLTQLKQSVDSIFAKHNISPDYYRNLICKGDPKEIKRKWRRKPACVGVSFYGRPPFQSTEENFDLVSKTFVNFVDVYMSLVEKHKNSPYTESDIVAQDTMRREWLIDQLFSDPYSSKIVPFEAWTLANVPPIIKF